MVFNYLGLSGISRPRGELACGMSISCLQTVLLFSTFRELGHINKETSFVDYLHGCV